MNASGDEPRTVRVNLRLSKSEHASFTAEADAQGVTIPRYLLAAAVEQGTTVSGATFVERQQEARRLLEIERQIVGIGVNINQMAKATNATLETQPEMFEAIAVVKRAMHLLENTVVELMK